MQVLIFYKPGIDSCFILAHARWARPELDHIIKDGRNDESVLFQLMDIDSFIGFFI